MLDFNVVRWAPKFILRDKNGWAVAKAIEAALRLANSAIEDGVRCITDYDYMPEWRLDEVAWELGIFYDYAADIETKRATVKAGAAVYRLLGTKAGVLQALRAGYEHFDMQEWFDYGGEPHHFRVELTNEGGYDFGTLGEIDRIVAYTKRLSSVFDELIVTTELAPSVVALAPGLGYAMTETVLPELERDYNLDAVVHMGGHTGTVTQDRLPAVERAYSFAATVHAGAAAHSVTSDELPALERKITYDALLQSGSAAGSVMVTPIGEIERRE